MLTKYSMCIIVYSKLTKELHKTHTEERRITMEKVTEKEKETLEECSKVIPQLNQYERGFLIGLMTGYSNQTKENVADK